MQEDINLNEEKVCRVCLEADELINIFESDADSEWDLGKKLADISGIEISVDDRLPMFVCGSCKATIEEFFDYKILVARTQNHFKLAMTITVMTQPQCDPLAIKTENFLETDQENSKYASETDQENKGDFMDACTEGDLTTLNVDCDPENDLTTTYSKITGRQHQVFWLTQLKKRHIRLGETHFYPAVQIGDETIKCSICNLKIFKSHKKLHTDYHEKFTIPCDECERFYYSELALGKHKANDHSLSPTTYDCHVCSETLPGTTLEILRHMKQMHKDAVYVQCTSCPKKFPTFRRFFHHMSVHKKTAGIPCPYCKAMLQTSDHLADHLKTDCNAIRKAIFHRCRICSKTFPIEDKEAHAATHHTNDLNLLCRICDVRFKKLSEFENHLLDVHSLRASKNNRFICKFCEHPLKTARGLRRHMRQHVEEPKYVCGVCDKAFHYTTQLASHQRRHMGDRTHECMVCKERFYNPTEVKRHAYRRHAIGAEGVETAVYYPYFCDCCAKKFRQQDRYLNHKCAGSVERGSESEKDFKFACEICGEKYRLELSLKYHICPLIQNRNQVCEICNKGYAYEKELIYHRMTTHGAVMTPCGVLQSTESESRDLDI